MLSRIEMDTSFSPILTSFWFERLIYLKRLEPLLIDLRVQTREAII